jgi:hypothetical protein
MASKKKGKKKYGAGARKTVKKVMHERKQGTLKSGRSKKKVKSRKQAIAIALSEARASGAKVPPRKKASRKASGKKSSAKKKTSSKKKSRKKS